MAVATSPLVAPAAIGQVVILDVAAVNPGRELTIGFGCCPFAERPVPQKRRMALPGNDLRARLKGWRGSEQTLPGGNGMQVLVDKQRLEMDDIRLEHGDTLYVHLNSGNVIEVRPATAVRLTEDAVLVLDGQDVVATFDRTAVYFAADVRMEPPSLE